MSSQYDRRLPRRNKLFQPMAQSRGLQYIQDQLPAHRRQRTCHRGDFGVGHDRGSHWAILLANHQLAIPNDPVQHSPLNLGHTKIGTSVRILHLIRWICCYACTHRKPMIAHAGLVLFITTDTYTGVGYQAECRRSELKTATRCYGKCHILCLGAMGTMYGHVLSMTRSITLTLHSGSLPNLRRSKIPIWLPDPHLVWRACYHICYFYEAPLQA